MSLPLYQIDAFTSRLFGGNPAAVVLLDAWPPDALLMAIAAENNLFAPRQGIPEDPATGSTNCTLVPYWAQRLGKAELVARQLSPRGDRVLIAGRTVEYLRGEITVES